jgi:hypothetical protein
MYRWLGDGKSTTIALSWYSATLASGDSSHVRAKSDSHWDKSALAAWNDIGIVVLLLPATFYAKIPFHARVVQKDAVHCQHVVAEIATPIQATALLYHAVRALERKGRSAHLG